MKIKTLMISITLLLTANIYAQKETSCRASAFITDRDSKGLNARGGAGTNFGIIGSIPFNEDGTIVEIIGSKDRWMKISGAQNAEGSRTFSKTGWVFAPYLAIGVSGKNSRTVRVYSSPNKSADIISNLPADTQYALESCSGSWLQIMIPGSGKNFSGWIAPENQCGNPWTSCS